MKSPLALLAVAVLFSSGVCAAMSGDAGSTDKAANVSATTASVTIPGPLRSFMRMAAISQKASTDEVLPLLGRNVFIEGYEGYQSSRRPTEFLILLSRYVQQAREISTLTDRHGILRVANCEQAKPVLRVLGYRIRPDCGKAATYLETAEPERAFITTDSGFPLPELEQSLRGGKPFEYDYTGSPVPILFTDREWIAAATANKSNDKDVIDVILTEPDISRLYWALSRLDPETTEVLRKSVGIRKLAPVAAVLDFYGTQLRIESGHVVVPGGAESEAAWKNLVGANPSNSGEFIQNLLAKDRGWLAAYFDALS